MNIKSLFNMQCNLKGKNVMLVTINFKSSLRASDDRMLWVGRRNCENSPGRGNERDGVGYLNPVGRGKSRFPGEGRRSAFSRGKG